jgi:hypothetical protein
VSMPPTCTIDGCIRKIKARGWCAAHYMRWQRHGDVEAGQPVTEPTSCQERNCTDDHHARGWCKRHYDRIRRKSYEASQAEFGRWWDACEDCGSPPLCGGRWCLPCFQLRATPKKASGCGTAAGWKRHRRRGETPCDECRRANSLRRQLWKEAA